MNAHNDNPVLWRIVAVFTANFRNQRLLENPTFSMFVFDIICAIRYNRHVYAPATGHFHIKNAGGQLGLT